MKLFTKVAIGSVAAIAGIAALATLGNNMNNQMLAACNAGDVSLCHSVFDGHTANKSMITNEEYFAIMETREAEDAAKAKPEVQEEPWVLAVRKHEIKMRWDCEDAIKSGLRDPRSYQANDVGYWHSMAADPALVMVKINYTAKNGFGGATRGNAVCHADANGNILEAKYL